MNPVLKETLVEAARLTATAVAVTAWGYLTVKVFTKLYGPIEVTVKEQK